MNWSFPFLFGESLLNLGKERDGVRDEKKGGTWNESKKLLVSDFVVGDDDDEESGFRLEVIIMLTHFYRKLKIKVFLFMFVVKKSHFSRLFVCLLFVLT
jgi:hypothetical protein